MRINGYLLLLFFALISGTALGQGNKVVRSFKGRVIDSATQLPLKDVSVCIYRARDTSLINFGFTTPNGNFNITTSSRDSIIIIFSLMGYNEKNVKDPYTERDWSFMNMNDVKLSVMPVQFKAYTVRSSAIRMKGDTMEIDAARFKVLPGSDVAQLFKKIPGFEVNVKGEIKVGGASVEKIMVDGSDFFGNNPGLVSKNLTSEMIETVQVFEEKNEDGSPKSENTRVINLKLKKGKRNGTFGDLLGGFGTNDNRYESGLRFNNFKNDRKLSFIFNGNNINSTGFDFGFNNWHGAQNDERNGSPGGNNFYTQFGSNQNSGNINNNQEAGFTYFNEFSRKRKFSVDLNFERNAYSSINASNSSSPFNDTVRRFNIDSNIVKGLSYSASLNIDYTKAIDSTGTFDIGTRSSIDLNNFNTDKNNIILFNTSEINRGINNLKNDMSNDYFRVTTNYGRSLRKNRRYRFSLHGNLRNFRDDNAIHQFLSNTLDTFNNRTAQKINRMELLLKFYGQMPVYKYWNFNLSGDRWTQDNTIDQRTNGVTNYTSGNFEGDYNIGIDSLSIKYKNTIEQYTLKPYFSYGKNQLYLNGGVTYMRYNLNNVDESTGASVYKSYAKGLPFFFMNYFSRNFGYFTFNANKGVTFPNSSDLMPVLNISNTYQRKTGNPDLEPQEVYSGRLYGNFNKIRGVKTLYASIRGSMSDNARIYISEINEAGIVSQKPINATGQKSVQGYLGFSKRLKKKIIWSNSLDYNYAISPAYINGLKSLNKSENYSYSPGISYEPGDSLETGFKMTLNAQNFKNELNSRLNYNQLTFGYNFNIRGVLKYGTEINSTLGIDDQRNVPGIGRLVTIWNLYVQQPLDKKGKFQMKISAYDILKQNTSISRAVNDNFISITQSNRLTRYFMLTLIYKIKSVGGGDDEQFVY